MSEDPLAHLGLVHTVAARHRGSLEYDDAVQVGCLGLLLAVARYDPARGTTFSTYAYRCIYGAVKEEERQRAWQPREARERGEEPHLVRQLLPEDNKPDWEDTAMDELEERECAQQQRQRLQAAVATLTPRQRWILKLRYRQGLPFHRIAQEIGVSESRACQLHRAALQQLRETLVPGP